MVEIKDTRPYLEMLLLPTGYSQILHEVRKNLESTDFVTRINDYADRKTSRGLRKSRPMFLNEQLIDSRDLQINNTTLLSQANHLGKLANDAVSDTRALLAHYAEHSLFAFFTYSILYFEQRANSHGLLLHNYNEHDPGKTEIKICSDGFFPRILDCYSILEADTAFSILRYNKDTRKFDSTNSPHSYLNEPVLTLEQLLTMRKALTADNKSFDYDIIDFLLIFGSSSITRYRPYVWRKIVQGTYSSDFAWFQQCFKRFNILKGRLTESLLHFSAGHDIFSSFGLWESFTDADYKLIRY